MKRVSGRTGSRKPSVVVTAGPTRERIDPVRFLSNYSTGVFGYAIAGEALRRGCAVKLISGPTGLVPPHGVTLVRVESALEMRKAVMEALPKADCLIMAAAVADWRVKRYSPRKLKRAGPRAILELAENPDILREAGRRRRPGTVLVGFALETEALEANALKKLRRKGLDMIVANRLGPRQGLFGERSVEIAIIDRQGRTLRFKRKTKRQSAKIIIDKALSFNI